MSDEEWIEWATRTEHDQPRPEDIAEWEAWMAWVSRKELLEKVNNYSPVDEILNDFLKEIKK